MSAERTDPTTSTSFAARMSVEQVEEGLALAPKFVFTESRKSFDPKDVYGDAPNPRRL